MLEQYLPDIALGTNGPGAIVESLLQDALSALALIALLMFVYSGVMMMAFGSDDDVRRKALRSLVGTVIGLAIILSSKGVVMYLLQNLGGATGTSVSF